MNPPPCSIKHAKGYNVKRLREIAVTIEIAVCSYYLIGSSGTSHTTPS